MKNIHQTTNGACTLVDLTKDYQGGILLYFYPKDMTSGCTKQAEMFRDQLSWFHDRGIAVVGVSRDSLSRHQKFIEKHELNFPLISDTEEALCQAFGVMAEKSMYGRKYMGVVRSTFWLSPELDIRHEWRGVKVPGHVDAVKQYIESVE